MPHFPNNIRCAENLILKKVTYNMERVVIASFMFTLLPCAICTDCSKSSLVGH